MQISVNLVKGSGETRTCVKNSCSRIHTGIHMAYMISDATETVKAESPGVSLGEEGDSSKISTDVPDSTTKGRFTFYEL